MGNEYIEVNWTNSVRNKKGDGSTKDDDSKNSTLKCIQSKNAALALRAAIGIARDFDSTSELRNQQRESLIPMFESQELVLGSKMANRSVSSRSRRSGMSSTNNSTSNSSSDISSFFTKINLRGIQLVSKLKHGEFDRHEREQRNRFVERCMDGYYSVKCLQNHVYYNSTDARIAAYEMMTETKILMNLSPHPNISQLYGVSAAGSQAFLKSGSDGFFIIVDHLSDTLTSRMNIWRHNFDNQSKNNIIQRLEIALDISSALNFLNNRRIVYNLRPHKVGFDSRYGTVKLCEFGQACEDNRNQQQHDDEDDNTHLDSINASLVDTLVGTDDVRALTYTAPEILCEAPITLMADVYAFGIVLWEIYSLRIPFDNILHRADHFEKVVIGNLRPKISQKWPDDMKKLIASCWDAHARPNMKKVFNILENMLLFLDDNQDLAKSFDDDNHRTNGHNSNLDQKKEAKDESANRVQSSKNTGRSGPRTNSSQRQGGSSRRTKSPSRGRSGSVSRTASSSSTNPKRTRQLQKGNREKEKIISRSRSNVSSGENSPQRYSQRNSGQNANSRDGLKHQHRSNNHDGDTTSRQRDQTRTKRVQHVEKVAKDNNKQIKQNLITFLAKDDDSMSSLDEGTVGCGGVFKGKKTNAKKTRIKATVAHSVPQPTPPKAQQLSSVKSFDPFELDESEEVGENIQF